MVVVKKCQRMGANNPHFLTATVVFAIQIVAGIWISKIILNTSSSLCRL
jgi:hypothetical protein